MFIHRKNKRKKVSWEYLILILAFLAGCTKDAGMLPGTKRQTASSVTLKVQFRGQSNQVYMNPDGMNAFAQSMGQQVTMDNCSIGGTYIAEHAAGGTIDNDCWARMSEPDVIFFYQGEADSQRNGAYDTWAQQFTDMVKAWRVKRPNLIVIFAQIGPDPNGIIVPIINGNGDRWLHWTEVQAQQASVSLPRVSMVKTNDLAVTYDMVHLAPESYIEVGRRYAQALKGIE